MRTLAALALLATACSRPGTKPAAARPDPAQPRIQVGSILNCNQLLHLERPVYPPAARAARVQGVVSLDALITKDGQVRVLEVRRGDPLLIPEARRVAALYRYSPCVFQGQPVEIRTVLEIGFTLAQ